MGKLRTITLVLLLLASCKQISSSLNLKNVSLTNLVEPSGTTLMTRINVPKGFERVQATKGSYTDYLRNLPLKPAGTKVRYFDGQLKEPNGIYTAVIDYDLGGKDLQQCADAVIRLRAEYLYATGQWNKIHFQLTNGFDVPYSRWQAGDRVAVNGNKTSWIHGTVPSNSSKTFHDYLDFVFTYAGSLSLSEQMHKVDFVKMQPGDAFIHGGSPGHCETVIDMAVNPQTGQKCFLLAQGYMPAQDIQVLINRNDPDNSPWYMLTDGDKVITPQYTFNTNELRRFAAE